jgi:hypothetical protein
MSRKSCTKKQLKKMRGYRNKWFQYMRELAKEIGAQCVLDCSN